jgi:ribonuclease T2
MMTQNNIANILLWILFAGITSVGFSLPAYAKGTACFEAKDACPAYQSYRKKTNPGNILLETGKRYNVLEMNSKKKRYRIKIDGIKKSARWVSGSCGTLLASCSSNAKRTVATTKSLHATGTPGQYLLALSWQPTFCESRPNKKECRSQTDNRYDASHLSLHGLWPQPRANAYCGVSANDKGIDRHKRWHLLAPVKLSQDTINKLAFVMPGYQSKLHRHEWLKHGTCYGTNADTYYQHAIELTRQVNHSAVGQLFAKNLGKRITLKQVRSSFDTAFGKGTGRKVDLRCDRKGRISELWINLKGQTIHKKAADLDISTLLNAAINAGSTCHKGVVDEAG